MDHVASFNEAWIRAANDAARARGIPERFLRAEGWSLSNLFLTDAGTFVFISYGDGKTVLAEWTEEELNEGMRYSPPKHPYTQGLLYGHPQWRGNSNRNPSNVGEFTFTTTSRDYTTLPGLTIQWWRQEEQWKRLVETVSVRFHMDGSASLEGYHNGSVSKDAPQKGDKPLTEALLAELSIPLVFEWRPMTEEDVFRQYRRGFIDANRPTPERQEQLQAELRRNYRIGEEIPEKVLQGKLVVDDLEMNEPIQWRFQPSNFLDRLPEEARRWINTIFEADSFILTTDIMENRHSQKLSFVKDGHIVVLPNEGTMVTPHGLFLSFWVHAGYATPQVHMRERAFAGDTNAQYIYVDRIVRWKMSIPVREIVPAGTSVKSTDFMEILRFDDHQTTIHPKLARLGTWIGRGGGIAKALAEEIGTKYVKIQGPEEPAVTQYFAD